MKEAYKKVTDVINNNKMLIGLCILIITAIVFITNKKGVIGNNNIVDNTSKVTTSQDTITDNGIKMGDIGSVKGDLTIGK